LSDKKASLLAGALAGVTGLIVFLVIHNFWIMPIWFILPIGLIISVLGGLAVGRAYVELLPNLPPRPWSIFLWMGLICIILLPSIILAEIRSPIFDVSVSGSTLLMSVERVAVLFILELLVTSSIIGGLAGWIISRTRRGMLSTALVGFVFALGPGHNIPFLGNTPGVIKGVTILLVIILVSTVILVEAQARLQR
jgi:hypothetical protein